MSSDQEHKESDIGFIAPSGESRSITITLAMILRNSAAQIRETLDHALPFVDELVVVDTGSTDDTKAVVERACQDHEVPLIWEDYVDPNGHPDWISDFAIPRNRTFELATKEMILWLDSDDTLVGGAKMREYVDQFCGDVQSTRLDAIVALYNYQRDDWGLVTVAQHRHRIVRNGAFTWDFPVHEDLSPSRPATRNRDRDPKVMGFWVDHRRPVREGKSSAERNLWIIEQWEKADKPMTPRLWKGKGDALRMLNRHEDAVAAYTYCIESGNELDELYWAHMRRGDSYQKLDEPEEALDDYARAERIRPSYSAAYIAAAEVFVAQELWHQAYIWCEKASMAGDDEDSIVWNPAITGALKWNRAQALIGLNRFEEARALLAEIEKATPGIPRVVDKLAAVLEALRQEQLFNACVTLRDIHGGDEQAAGKLADLVPAEVRKFPGLSDLFIPPLEEGQPRIVLVCAQTINTWGPAELEEGTGGSEEAAIYTMQELAKRGWRVEVYNNCGDKNFGQDEHGVIWLPWHAWDPHSEADIFIGWRNTAVLAGAWNSKRRYMYLEDIPWPERWTPAVSDGLDGIFCVSKYQASILPAHAQEKVIITANGLDPNKFKDGPNDHNRFIYASSPDRGLEELFAVWPKIKEALPEAELDVFYGFRDVWSGFQKQNRKMRELRERILQRYEELKDMGVHWRGFVGATELHEAFAEAGFWLYPTSFQESFCTTAAKAMAMGAIPITSRCITSSLPEVCGKWDLGPDPTDELYFNHPERLDIWAQHVIDVAQEGEDLDGHRKAMKAWARKEYPWSKVGDQWNEIFRSLDLSESSPGAEERRRSIATATQEMTGMKL